MFESSCRKLFSRWKKVRLLIWLVEGKGDSFRDVDVKSLGPV